MQLTGHLSDWMKCKREQFINPDEVHKKILLQLTKGQLSLEIRIRVVEN